MRQWIGSALVQIIAIGLFGAKPLSKPMLVIVNLTLRNKLQWNLNRNIKNFIQENASGNIVCEMAAILSRPQCVNPWMKLIQGLLIPTEAVVLQYQTHKPLMTCHQFPSKQMGLQGHHHLNNLFIMKEIIENGYISKDHQRKHSQHDNRQANREW